MALALGEGFVYSGRCIRILLTMKSFIYYIMAVTLVAMGSMVATTHAQEDDQKKPAATKTAKKKEADAVAKGFKKAHSVQGKLNPNAKCYVYLQSASWCGPCRAEMPKLVSAYKEMKEAGVEVILCGRDEDKAGVKGYIKEFKIPFPAVVAKSKLPLPGFKYSSSVPHATFVDKNGKVLKDGHGNITLGWQEILDKLEKDKPEDTEEEES